jgi:hypothetical protein
LGNSIITDFPLKNVCQTKNIDFKSQGLLLKVYPEHFTKTHVLKELYGKIISAIKKHVFQKRCYVCRKNEVSAMP